MTAYKCKVEEIETTDRGGKSIKLSGEWSGSALFTGKDKDKNVVPLPDEVKVGATVECEIEAVKTRSGGEWYPIEFPKYYKQATSSGKGSWQGGRQEDVELKIASFAMSYAKDLYMNTPEATLEGMFETCDKIAAHMLSLYKKLKG